MARSCGALAYGVTKPMVVNPMRYLKIFLYQTRTSLLLLLQYRFEFFVGFLMAGFWALSALIPLFVVFQNKQAIAGWNWPETLLVAGWFNLLKGLQSTLIRPSMQQAVEHVRKGTLDFFLIKPVDAQFLISTARFDFRELNGFLVGCIILAVGLWNLSFTPSLINLMIALFLLICGALILYAIWIMVMSLAFIFIRVDNLTHLFSSIYDVARWPSTIYHGVFAFVFTFVLPFAVMTTFPTLALLDKLGFHQVLGATVGTAIFMILCRWVWKSCLLRYTGAGG